MHTNPKLGRRARFSKIGSKLNLAIQTAILAGSGALQGIPHANAQVGALEEIVVTVRRREEMAASVPMAITAMTPDFMEDQGINAVEDLNETVTGFNITQGTNGPNFPVVALRGQRPTEVLLTLDPAVPLYFADVVLTPVNGSNLAIYDLANIQVLKGPQGTLFGRNSTGGSVLLTPQTPESELGGYAKFTVGNYDLYKFQGAVSLPVNDVLGFRLAGQKTTRDGYQSIVDNGLPTDQTGSTSEYACDDCLWDEDSEGIRLVTSIDTGDFRNLLTLSYDKNDSIGKLPNLSQWAPNGLGAVHNFIYNGGFAALGIPGTPAETLIEDAVERQKNRSVHDVEASFLPEELVENTFVANATEFDINDELTIKNIIGYRKVEVNISQDNDGTALDLIGNVVRTDTLTPGIYPASEETPSVRDLHGEQFSNELQFIGSAFDDRLEWLAGLYYYRMKGAEHNLAINSGLREDFPTFSPFPAGHPLYALWGYGQNGFYSASSFADVENTAYAIFGEGTYELNDDFSLTVGLRQTWDKRELTSHNIKTLDPYSSPTCSIRDEDGNLLPNDSCERSVNETFSRPTWRLALNYSPEHGKLMYASIATGYRTGGFQTRAEENRGFEPFDEETVLTYEIGHKADWDAGELGDIRTGIAIYYQDYDDIQKTQGALNADGNFVTTIINAASAVVQGVDLDVTIAPTENFSITMGYAYIDAYYKDWIRPFVARNGDVTLLDNSSSPFIFVPEHSLFASAQYTLPVDPTLGDITLIGGFYYQSKVDSFAEPQHLEFLAGDSGIENRSIQVQDGYSTWNFRLKWDSIMGSNFDAAAYIDNAFDKEYRVGGTSGIATLGMQLDSYGPPRTFGASLQWNF